MYRQSEKNLLSSNISSSCPHNMVNFRPLAAKIVSLVWGTPANFNGFCFLAALLHGTLLVGVSQTAALNRGRQLYLAGRPSRWALAHISSFIGATCVVSLLPPPRRLCNRRCLSVCLSVCLLATLHRNFQTDLHEIFRERWQWTGEQMIKFWWRIRITDPDPDTDPDPYRDTGKTVDVPWRR